MKDFIIYDKVLALNNHVNGQAYCEYFDIIQIPVSDPCLRRFIC